jgi:pyridoxine 5-phosphate synthase
MIHLSVNVNKVATLRNARGGSVPSVLEAVDVCVAAGVHGITVHPRADQRHITAADVRAIARALRAKAPTVEYNIEGDPRPDLIDLVEEVQPDQCTLVPVTPGEITSQAGWQQGPATERLPETIRRLQARGVRVSLFVDAEPAPVSWAASVGADRVELYTEPCARAFGTVRIGRRAFLDGTARTRGLGVNAGHDLDLANLVVFAICPSSTKSRSGTRLARCSWAWRRWCTSISRSSPRGAEAV